MNKEKTKLVNVLIRVPSYFTQKTIIECIDDEDFKIQTVEEVEESKNELINYVITYELVANGDEFNTLFWAKTYKDALAQWDAFIKGYEKTVSFLRMKKVSN